MKNSWHEELRETSKANFSTMCHFSSQKNLILGRIKQGWIGNCLNNLSIDCFAAGDRENRGQRLQRMECLVLTEIKDV